MSFVVVVRSKVNMSITWKRRQQSEHGWHRSNSSRTVTYRLASASWADRRRQCGHRWRPYLDRKQRNRSDTSAGIEHEIETSHSKSDRNHCSQSLLFSASVRHTANRAQRRWHTDRECPLICDPIEEEIGHWWSWWLMFVLVRDARVMDSTDWILFDGHWSVRQVLECNHNHRCREISRNKRPSCHRSFDSSAPPSGCRSSMHVRDLDCWSLVEDHLDRCGEDARSFGEQYQLDLSVPIWESDSPPTKKSEMEYLQRKDTSLHFRRRTERSITNSWFWHRHYPGKEHFVDRRIIRPIQIQCSKTIHSCSFTYAIIEWMKDSWVSSRELTRTLLNGSNTESSSSSTRNTSFDCVVVVVFLLYWIKWRQWTAHPDSLTRISTLYFKSSGDGKTDGSLVVIGLVTR